jgi:unspecific monooxygenase
MNKPRISLTFLPWFLFVQAAQDSLHREMTETDQSSIQTMAFLTAVVYESLRLLPPISQLITRRAASTVMLDDAKVIPEGTYIGYHSYSTNRDPAAWGADADEFRPERWGTSYEDVQRAYRQRRSRAEFISFHGGRRACLGEKYALMQIKITLFSMVSEFRWKLDPAWPERMSAVRASLVVVCLELTLFADYASSPEGAAIDL